MKTPEIWIALFLVVFNLSAGIGFAFPLAKNLQQIKDNRQKSFRNFLGFTGLYFAECVAFAMGMCSQIFTVALSFVWTLVLVFWLKAQLNTNSLKTKIIRLAILIAIYGSLPTASFCILITGMKVIQGANILSASEGIAFGIPDFLPWPFNSILGFSAALLAGTLILKIVVSSVTLRYIIRHSKFKAD